MKVLKVTESIVSADLIRAAENCSKLPGYCCLNTPDARYFFLEPLQLIVAGANSCNIIANSGSEQINIDPITVIDKYLNPILTSTSNVKLLPCAAGYFAYELADFLPAVPWSDTKSLSCPVIHFAIYSKILKYKPGTAVARLYTVRYVKDLKPLWLFRDVTATDYYRSYPSNSDFNINNLYCQAKADLDSCALPDAGTYKTRIKKIIELIADGQVYQINLTRRYELPCELEPYNFYLIMEQMAAAEYRGYLNCTSMDGNPFSIVSASPERFFSLRNNALISSPIKGSAPRSSSPEQDHLLRESLLSSEKDRAELAMIVDLIRNDLGRIAVTGSVRVNGHALLKKLPHIYHLYSDVSCRLPESVTLTDIINALFPCGSITGAPKIAAMQYIRELECCPREVYTGAIGCIGPGNFADFNVAIRTGIIKNQKLSFNTGGGIVFDSKPELEHQESITKALDIFAAWLTSAANQLESHVAF
ncbi:MAG: anthranilate synthase component I family protein [Candidatus Dadabacteria bacterium]|nr:MAG: anthranilate synthase component I family protein [Candidatus Dadabacteria bacterium]